MSTIQQLSTAVYTVLVSAPFKIIIIKRLEDLDPQELLESLSMVF